jgi:hypothetical protein
MSGSALSIKLGAQAAELKHLNGIIAELKQRKLALEAKVKSLEGGSQNSSLQTRLAALGCSWDGKLSRESLDQVHAFLEGFSIKLQQLAEAQAASLGFAHITDAELNACVGS